MFSSDRLLLLNSDRLWSLFSSDRLFLRSFFSLDRRDRSNLLSSIESIICDYCLLLLIICYSGYRIGYCSYTEAIAQSLLLTGAEIFIAGFY